MNQLACTLGDALLQDCGRGALEESKLGVGGRPEVLKGEAIPQALDTAESKGCQ
jgi:hypothetical protein